MLSGTFLQCALPSERDKVSFPNLEELFWA